jgi:Fe-S-cluster-containing hydrogenase component 2
MMDKKRTYKPHIIQAPPELSLCTGCSTCEIVCSLIHEGAVSPSYTRIFVERQNRTMVHAVLSCRQCEDPPCYESCPKKGSAMRLDGRGVVSIDEEHCLGCGLCVGACVFDPPRINLVKSEDRKLRKAKKCDLCAGRAEGPACVQWCPARCLSVGSEVE